MVALYGKKVGMTHVFDEDGCLVPVTVLYIEPNVVIGSRNIKKNGYDSKILATYKNKPSRFTKAQLGMFNSSIDPRKKIYEVRGFENVESGTELGVEVFEAGKFVDVTGTSKGKGFQGVMRRHGHHGGPARVGSKFHRTGGSTGHAANPSRVRKGTKMAGHMGNVNVTTQNLQIMKLNKDNGILVVKGAVPGAIGGQVLIRNAKKKEI